MKNSMLLAAVLTVGLLFVSDSVVNAAPPEHAGGGKANAAASGKDKGQSVKDDAKAGGKGKPASTQPADGSSGKSDDSQTPGDGQARGNARDNAKGQAQGKDNAKGQAQGKDNGKGQGQGSDNAKGPGQGKGQGSDQMSGNGKGKGKDNAAAGGKGAANSASKRLEAFEKQATKFKHIHEERSAKLNRIAELGKESNRPELVERANKLQAKETERYQKQMTNLAKRRGEITAADEADAQSELDEIENDIEDDGDDDSDTSDE